MAKSPLVEEWYNYQASHNDYFFNFNEVLKSNLKKKKFTNIVTSS